VSALRQGNRTKTLEKAMEIAGSVCYFFLAGLCEIGGGGFR
jgi:hypothetical protein